MWCSRPTRRLLFIVLFAAAPGVRGAEPQVRVLTFPDRAVGIVHTRPAPAVPQDWRALYDGWTRVSEARGEVRVPEEVQVRLDVSQAASRDLRFLDRLGPDDLQYVSLRNTEVRDEGLAHVGRLKGLLLLDLDCTRITDAGFRHLFGLTRLQFLTFDAFGVEREGFGISDESLRGLALTKPADLQGIHLRVQKITGAGVAALGLIKSLRLVGLQCKTLTDDGLAHLKRLPHLEALRLGAYEDGAQITDAGLATIGAMVDLKRLDLSGTRVTDEGLKSLQDLKRLESLVLDSTQVTEAGLAHLEPLTALTHLRCYLNAPISDVGARHLAKLGSLTEFTARLAISDDGLAAMAELPRLEQLDLLNASVSDAGVRNIQRMKSLKTLWFQHCPITDAGLAELAGHPALEFLLLGGTRVSGEGLRHLKGLPRLNRLQINFGAPGDDFYGERPTLRFVGELTGLTWLSVGGRGLDGAELRCLDNLTKLTTFECGIAADDLGAFYIAGLPSLESLSFNTTVNRSSITDEGLAQLSTLRALKRLTISGHFTAQGLQRLKHLPALAFVGLSSPYIAKADVDELAAECPSIQSANFYAYRASPFADVTVGKHDGFRREGSPEQRELLDALEGSPPPALTVGEWINGGEEGVSLAALKGKLILVAFWNHSRPRAAEQLEKLQALHERYAPQGLAVLGIHSTAGADELADFLAQRRITWPIAADAEGATEDAWHVHSHPCYLLIDRTGKLRIAGAYRGDLERIIKELLVQ